VHAALRFPTLQRGSIAVPAHRSCYDTAELATELATIQPESINRTRSVVGVLKRER